MAKTTKTHAAKPAAGFAPRRPRRQSKPIARPDPSQVFAIEAARLIRDDKCEDVALLDVRGISPITDFIIVASGTSERQMGSVLRHVEDLGAKLGFQAFRSNADDHAAWLLADFVDVVVHLFEPNTRAHYDIETLWAEAPRIEWEREDQKSRDRAGLNA